MLRAEVVERALGAARPGAAGLLAEAHELGVVVVVERGVARQMAHQELLHLVVGLRPRAGRAIASRARGCRTGSPHWDLARAREWTCGRNRGRGPFIDTPPRVPDNARGRKSGYCFIFGASAEGNMSLEDELKARTSALISEQMANWVVEIQRAIQGHQASLLRELDELGETVARYDEKVDEQSIGAAMAAVLAQQPPPAPTADYSALKASIAVVEKGANLSEVLTHLVSEVSKHVERVRDVHRQEQRGRGLVRARLRPQRRGEGPHAPAHRGHGLPPRPRQSASHPRTREPFAGNRAGPVPSRWRPPGRPGRSPHPARQGGGHPLLRHLPGGDARRHRRPRRDPRDLRGQGDRRAERRRATRRPRPGRGRHEPRPPSSGAAVAPAGTSPGISLGPGTNQPQAGPSTVFRPPTTPPGRTQSPLADARARPGGDSPAAHRRPPFRRLARSPPRPRRRTTTPSASRGWW